MAVAHQNHRVRITVTIDDRLDSCIREIQNKVILNPEKKRLYISYSDVLNLVLREGLGHIEQADSKWLEYLYEHARKRSR